MELRILQGPCPWLALTFCLSDSDHRFSSEMTWGVEVIQVCYFPAQACDTRLCSNGVLQVLLLHWRILQQSLLLPLWFLPGREHQGAAWPEAPLKVPGTCWCGFLRGPGTCLSASYSYSPLTSLGPLWDTPGSETQTWCHWNVMSTDSYTSSTYRCLRASKVYSTPKPSHSAYL